MSPKRSAHPFHRYSPPHVRPSYSTQFSTPTQGQVLPTQPPTPPKFSTPPATPQSHRRSPPLLPPARPLAKALKAHSQGDGLDKTDGEFRPPVPPRPNRLNNPGFYSPGPRPRRPHYYEDADKFTKRPNYADVDFASKRRVY